MTPSTLMLEKATEADYFALFNLIRDDLKALCNERNSHHQYRRSIPVEKILDLECRYAEADTLGADARAGLTRDQLKFFRERGL